MDKETKRAWTYIGLGVGEVAIIIGAFAILEVLGIKNVNNIGKVMFGFSFVFAGILLRMYFGEYANKPVKFADN